MIELAPEDSLRLHVLLSGEVQAVRIEEASLTVRALTPQGEVAVRLHPTGRIDSYLRIVRELFAGHASGSPGGYPVYLQRWTRMGQVQGGLDRLLLFGEPEAVISVACSASLTDELARRAWWAMPDSENARRMLARRAIVEGRMGEVLATHLLEHLPFETSPAVLMETVRLLLEPGLLGAEERERLWQKGKQDRACHVGFLERIPDELPETDPPFREEFFPSLQEMAERGNDAARLLARVLSGTGQAFLRTAAALLRNPQEKEVASASLDALARYFSILESPSFDSAEEAIRWAKEKAGADEVVLAFPELRPEVEAMFALSGIDSRTAYPVLSRTTASGTLLGSKLEPLVLPVLALMRVLRGGREETEVRRRRRARGGPEIGA